MNDAYNKETIDAKLNLIHEKVCAIENRAYSIEKQTIRTNGRVTKLERYILIVGCVTGTLVIVKFPEVFEILTRFL